MNQPYPLGAWRGHWDQLSVISYQLSVISYQLSVIIDYWLL